MHKSEIDKVVSEIKDKEDKQRRESLAKLIKDIKTDEKSKKVGDSFDEEFKKMNLKQQEKNQTLDNILKKIKEEEKGTKMPEINVHKYWEPKIIGHDDNINLHDDLNKILEHNTWKKNEADNVFALCEDSSIVGYQEYEALFKKLKNSKQKFVDPNFPPQDSSLIAENSQKKWLKKIFLMQTWAIFQRKLFYLWKSK